MIESVSLNPSAEPLEHAVPLAKFIWQLAPLRPGAHNPKNGLNEQPRVASGLSWIGGLAEAIRFDNCPLGVG